MILYFEQPVLSYQDIGYVPVHTFRNTVKTLKLITRI